TRPRSSRTTRPDASHTAYLLRPLLPVRERGPRPLRAQPPQTAEAPVCPASTVRTSVAIAARAVATCARSVSQEGHLEVQRRRAVGEVVSQSRTAASART